MSWKVGMVSCRSGSNVSLVLSGWCAPAFNDARYFAASWAWLNVHLATIALVLWSNSWIGVEYASSETSPVNYQQLAQAANICCVEV